MLEFLHVADFALIEDLSLPFHPGLTVLTGETGAGKSIIVDALLGALGEKVDPDMVRSGADSALVEASFGMGKDEEVILRREVPREGRGRAFVNGALAPLAKLKEAGDALADLHGQHEHQALLRVSEQLAVLDAFGGLLPARERHALVYREWKETQERLSSLRTSSSERAARADYLRFVAKELAAARLAEGEDEALAAEEKVLAQAERLMTSAGAALEALEQEEGSAVARLVRAVGVLRDLAAVDGKLAEVAEILESAKAQAKEAAHLVQGWLDRLTADPGRLQVVSDRLALIKSLKKKYGPTLSDVAATMERSRTELERMESEEGDAGDLTARERELAGELGKTASDLSEKRKKAAARLEKKVKAELADLAMEKTRFSVAFSQAPMGESGSDAVEFLIAPNPGEPLLPLRKIASGGELSRVMLAAKTILGESDRVPTLVFDEVDAGIGGQTARVLGKKLREISRTRQVLCITHLAPVAAAAHQQVLVEKSAEKGRTVVRARYLSREERVEELARMMGGKGSTPRMMESARELLEAESGR